MDRVVKHPLFQGPGVMMGGYFCFAIIPLCARVATKTGVPSSEVVFFRFFLGIIFIGGMLLTGRMALKTQNFGVLALRGIFGGLAVSCYFYAIQRTTAANGVLLNYTHSIWTNLFAVLLFSQKPPKGFVWVLGLAIAGVVLVLDPRFNTVNMGDLLGLISGAFGGAAIMCIKKLRMTDNALTIFTSFTIGGVTFALIPLLVHLAWPTGPMPAWVMPGPMIWLALLGVAAASFAGQMLFAQGYAYTSLPVGTVLSLSTPAMVAVGEWLFLDEPLTPLFVIGGLMILTACGLVGYLESKTSLEDTLWTTQSSSSPKR